jgi:hypothetical protein
VDARRQSQTGSDVPSMCSAAWCWRVVRGPGRDAEDTDYRPHRRRRTFPARHSRGLPSDRRKRAARKINMLISTANDLPGY